MRLIWLIFAIVLSWIASQSLARQIKVVTIASNPFYTSKTGGGQEGYLVDLMRVLAEKATSEFSGEEIRHRFHLVSDGKYGMPDANGRWDGMIGEVINGQADVAVAAITVNKARREVVYFSHPFMSVVIVPLVKKPAPGAHMPFNNFGDFVGKLQSGRYVVGYIQHGSTESYLQHHHMPEIQNIYNISKAAHTESPYVESYEAGVARVRNSDGRFFFFGEHPTFLQFAAAQPCDVMIDWKGSVGVRFYAFAFPKTEAGRELMEKFNRLIVAAQEDGTAAMLEHKWWFKRSQCPREKLCICDEADDLTVQQS
jgi:ABC-type amino acid transport substrate-binding protein